ncbi:hypothetical protein JF66_08340 [Cryobacterium sp. MLB-32]|uniref:hypothetical protein n=1 Tax=Cryobacterium sp. MLB-32 TaxID=1529318 RepID=UPI0004E712D2|nr:hypothetical protein [Cryobacterium sp. MLB-32]KFF59859.1 hypothetical protein JF66_08340 [Cryobacterium sp. MLB-32]
MTTYKASADSARPGRRPVVTWALMGLALAVVALMPDWTGSGDNRPLWLFAIPVVLGLVGAGFAVRARHVWWAVASALWGFALIQLLVVVVTLVSGP